ncbi:hypothetical protein BKM09_005780 [Pseudomonas amygdali pv. morsprunorum]|nr:hypothetical protein BKM19_023280 [Pseudomonas amygdali pv. morsprunorum]POP81464.1 hypothetical protein CXB39_30725 [Pseudomonas amygdali pv. morsprunorum]POY78473.1 hypothetical protein BKM09_005780 [Pseudomonas amygdali pv. morsprunorum]
MRHRSAPHRTFKSGRRASRMAFPRWSVRNDNRQSTIVPMLCVGMQFVTLCVTGLRRTAHSRADAERPEWHSHAGACGTIIVRAPSCQCSALACSS